MAAGAGALAIAPFSRPAGGGRSHSSAPPIVVLGDGVRGPAGMAWIPPGEFLMGSGHRLAQPNERPVHRVRLHGFWMDRTHVTNAQFARFVAETGHLTTAEQVPDWESIRVQLPPGTPRPPASLLVPGAMVFTGTRQPVRLDDYSRWWTYVPGASWRQPQGPGSSIADRPDHPVVQVSHDDARAYARWAGKQLATEAQWEYAARGGLEQATYAWGEDDPHEAPRANTWDTRRRPFPVVDPRAGGAAGTLPVTSFPPNGWGLFDMTGNAWQWVADWYRADQFARQAARANGHALIEPTGPPSAWAIEPGTPADAPRRVIRGGSFLCNPDYCLSFRPSARRGSDPASPMSHLGFRLVSLPGTSGPA